MTFRPTFNEVKRTHTLLSKLEHYDASYLEFSRTLESKSEKLNKNKESQETDKKVTKSSKTKTKNVKPHEELDMLETKTKDESSSEDEEENELEKEMQGPEVNTTNDDFIQSLSSFHLKIFNDIYTACLTNNATKLEQLLTKSVENESVNFETLLTLKGKRAMAKKVAWAYP